MTQFKVGDEVELIEGYGGLPEGHRFTITDVTPSGDPDDGGMIYGDSIGVVFGRRLKLVERTMDNLQKGDVVTEGGYYSEDLTVGERLGDFVFLLDEEGHADEMYTVKELKDKGFTLKLPEPEIETKEMTVAEVAEELGYNVKIVEG